MYSVNDTLQAGWVSPFGHPRIKACLTAPRGLSWPTTSFIASSCQGIHHVRFVAWPHNHGLFTTWQKVKRENQNRSLYKPRTRSHEKLLQLITTSIVQILHLYNLKYFDYKLRSQNLRLQHTHIRFWDGLSFLGSHHKCQLTRHLTNIYMSSFT